MGKGLQLLIIILLIAFISFCKKKEDIQSSENETITEDSMNNVEEISPIREETKNPSLPSPNGYLNIAETKGDLDGDKEDELVVVYDNQKKDELGTQRELHIFKKNGDKWDLLHKSIGPILSSMAGGMMADPFESISIENKAIVIRHYGGGREKWSYTHRFRFQNENWFLIGATIEYMVVCEESNSYDYNLSTNKVIVTNTKEKCDNEGNIKGDPKTKKEGYTIQEKNPIFMDGFVPGNTEAKITKDKTFYF